MKSDEHYQTILERARDAAESQAGMSLRMTGNDTISVNGFALHADDLSIYLLYTDQCLRLGALQSQHVLQPADRNPRIARDLPLWKHGQRYAHRKGGTYRLRGSISLHRPHGEIVSVLYESEDDGTMWLRDETEFFDGRFKPI